MQIVRGTTNDNTNPRVLFAWQSPNVGDSLETGTPPSKRQLKGGFFQPFSELSFEVLRPDGSTLVPSTVVDVALEANYLDPASDGGKQRIVILPFSVGAAEPVGTYTANVTFIADPDDGPAIPVQTIAVPFRVLDDGHPLVAGYAQIVDAIDQGFPINDPTPCGGYSYTQAKQAIERASRYVEQITGRFFENRYLVNDYDGDGGPALQIDNPIIGMTDVTFTFTTFTPADLPIEEGDLRVYNRHMRQNLTQPDDREDPRVEFLRTPNYRYPRAQLVGSVDILSSYIGFTDSQQNVKLKGMFGYTDYDGTPFGKTPDLITEVTLRIAARYIGNLWTQIGGAGTTSSVAGPILSEKTMDQSVTFANALSSGGGGNNAFAGVFTGDPEIDQLLALYMLPPRFRSA
jgi:hypothetical protein